MTKLSERQLRWLLGGLAIGCFALFLALETATQDEAVTLLDFVGDAANLLLTIGAATVSTLLLLRIRAQHEEQMTLIRDLAIARAEGSGWRAKVHSHLAGLRSEMDRQLQDWGMTEAERDVGLLILKGLSHKEIATLRNTTDATVRQQAQSIYRKAGLPGKTAFSAYFLEDLLTSEAVTDGPKVGGSPGLGREPAAAQRANGYLGASAR
jgi:DNA-binding CsgD family transcriptional regulator